MFPPIASFVPPDVEDPPTPVELDEDDLEWQKWLVDVFNPAGFSLLFAYSGTSPLKQGYLSNEDSF